MGDTIRDCADNRHRRNDPLQISFELPDRAPFAIHQLASRTACRQRSLRRETADGPGSLARVAPGHAVARILNLLPMCIGSIIEFRPAREARPAQPKPNDLRQPPGSRASGDRQPCRGRESGPMGCPRSRCGFPAASAVVLGPPGCFRSVPRRFDPTPVLELISAG